jgi:hypothetical protein
MGGMSTLGPVMRNRRIIGQDSPEPQGGPIANRTRPGPILPRQSKASSDSPLPPHTSQPQPQKIPSQGQTSIPASTTGSSPELIAALGLNGVLSRPAPPVMISDQLYNYYLSRVMAQSQLGNGPSLSSRASRSSNR